MKTTLLILMAALCIACNNNDKKETNKSTSSSTSNSTVEKERNNKEGEKNDDNGPIAGRHYSGSFSNGMKGNKISFDISEDGTKLENLTFIGYWHCSGKLEQTTAGPDGAFTIEDNKVNHHISEPPNGGSTAWRFDLNATFSGNTASGTFRMNINNLGCDSYLLKWTASAE